MTKDQQRAISPREAARRSGISRSTIMRALSSRELKAIRDNRNQWQIAVEALDEWFSAQRGPARSMTMDHHEPPQVDQMKAQNIAAEARADRAEIERDAARAMLAAEESRRQSVEADRDAWRDQAQKLIDSSSRRRWWPWSR